MLASDIPALLPYTRDFYELSEKEIVILKKDSIQFFDVNKEQINKTTFHVDWDIDAASLCGYEHFMIKEIMEQPKALKDTIASKIKQGEVYFSEFFLTKQQIEEIDRFYIVACGSAAHAGIVGKHVIQQLTRMPVEVELASEFRYQNPIISDKTLVIIISQSGETADSLAALKYAKKRNAKTLAIVNVVGSAIAKAADHVIYTNAGPEISVATTKAYSCQLAILYLLAIYLARKTEKIDDIQNKKIIEELNILPQKVAEILEHKNEIQYMASRHYNAKDVFYIGRNLDYAAALEASLKLKEISYIHSEAYAAGELKHGTIALVENGTLIIAVAVNEKMFDKLSSNILEVKARGAEVIALTWKSNQKINNLCESIFFVPETIDIFTPTLTIIPLQLFAYYVASMKGLDIDKPRNLAKSVTVE
jgi:glucosamine--fructose-6-phosphate aminotransferase (isomerizing)